MQAPLWPASQFPLSALACPDPPPAAEGRGTIRYTYDSANVAAARPSPPGRPLSTSEQAGARDAGIQGGPRLGDAEAGAAAALGGPQFAAWSGGVLSMVTAVVTCWLLPGMWRYDSRLARPGQRGRDAEGRPEPDPVG